MTRRRQRRAKVVVQLIAGLALIGSAGVVAATSGQPAGQPSTTPSVDGAPTRFGALSAEEITPTESSYRLAIPAIGVDAPIVSVDVDDGGVLGVPTDPAAIGWWADGPVPGSDRGTSILAGHVNTAEHGPGALLSLDRVRAGDLIVVSGWDEPATFTVQRVERYPRDGLPANAFDQQGSGRLAIVSCTELDVRTGIYAANLVVYAQRTTGPLAPGTPGADLVTTEGGT